MFTICKGSQNIVEETLTDKAANVRKLLQNADAIINAKMDQNEAKYPVEKCRGSNAKYDQL